MRPLPRRGAAVACVVLVALLPALAHACGACDEDNVAATYDHRIAVAAAKAHDVLVYCRLEGAVDARRTVASLRRVRGVKAQSARLSVTPAALSFAFDPALQSAEGAVAAIEHGLPQGSRLRIVKVVATTSVRAVP